MSQQDARGFRFGVEAEFLLVDACTHRPLWHHDLSFEVLNEILASIPLDGLPSLAGLELERPHRKLMPYVVEGYHIPDPDFAPIDLLPKGVEIRTPVAASVEECLALLKLLYSRMQAALRVHGYRALALSHHPTEHSFEGPQNKRRHDFWRWAMEVMVTYGPDINVSLPQELLARLDLPDLFAKVNYYAPALTALSLAAPIYRGGLWEMRGQVGKSIRTFRRSVVAPVLEVHLEEAGRLEFKSFDMPTRLDDFHALFLVWLALLLDGGLKGRASDQERIYDLGAVARFGLEVETVRARAAEVLDGAPQVLSAWGLDSAPLDVLANRLASGRLPADEIADSYRQGPSLEALLRRLADETEFGSAAAAAAPPLDAGASFAPLGVAYEQRTAGYEAGRRAS